MIAVFELIIMKGREFPSDVFRHTEEVSFRFLDSFASAAEADAFMSAHQEDSDSMITVDMDVPDQEIFHRTSGGFYVVYTNRSSKKV